MDLEKLRESITAFRDARDWKQFHEPKDMAISLMLEAAELAELFQWKTKEELKSLQGSDAVGNELADVLYWVVLLANDFEVDLGEAFEQKMKLNKEKYPIEKAKGNNLKYSEL